MFKLRFILVLMLFANVLQAQSDITISSSATSNGSWSGGTPDVFTPSGNSANILYSEIESRLVTKGVTINTAGAGSQSGNVVISNAITAAPTTSSSNVFTINATGSITLNSSCNINTTAASSTNQRAGASISFSAGSGITLSSNITTTGGINTNGGASAGVGGAITLSSTSGTISVTGTFTTSGGNGTGWETAGGAGGNISITAPIISTSNTISTTGGSSNGNSTPAPNGGSVTMSGSTSISISGAITTTGGTSSNNAGGAGGAISLTSSAGNITTSATLTSSGASTAQGGNGGSISITANSGTASLSALVANGGNSNNWAVSSGTGGAVTISASVISATSISAIAGNLTNGGSIAANGGAISLTSANATTLSGSITNSGGNGGTGGTGGNGGTVSITSTSSNVSTQGITSSGGGATSTGGNGGTITITANSGTATTSGTLTSAGGSVTGWAATGGTGNNITINASNISSSTISTIGGNVTNGGAAGANGGNVSLNATSSANVAGDITTSGGTGNAGGISGTVSITGTGGINLSGNITTTSTTAANAGAVTINDGNTTVTSGGVNDGQTAGVINSGTATFTKTGNGYFKLASANTYTGYTQITAGRLIDASAERISNSSTLRLNGGTFNSGSTTGYDETFNTLDLNANSTIALGTGSHSISFANSSGVSWAGSTLTISGWTGTAGSSGTAGKIFVGNTTGTLTVGQLAKISFTGFTGATILNTGEVVPTAVALPVELISFVAVKNNNGNQLTWVTAQEVNNDYFEIQRSHDGIEFEKIAVVKGFGTKSSTTNYTYTDESSNKVLPTYYRLKQVDYDGKFDLSNIVYVNGDEGHKDFHLYPNPLEEGKTLYACLGDDDEGIVKVSLYDMSGKLLQTFLIDKVEIGGNITIENENLLLKKGMYIIEVNSVHNDYKQKLEVK